MLSRLHLKLIIEQCREIGWDGLNNGVTASIPQIEIDILNPPHDFLGAKGNPAIFVNKDTYKLLGSLHKNWIENKTIALKRSFLNQSTIDVIGAIVHETGHAFNVAANIKNTEVNAYIYEIEVMKKLLETKSPLLFGCTFMDLQSFFQKRLSFYEKDTRSNNYLKELVETIKEQFKLKEDIPSPKQFNTEQVSFSIAKGLTLFTQKHWNKENTLIVTKMAISL
ncbi:MAG: hypothetical protein HYX60_05460 [Legionella longbeachae]|nr:hypothetical protein [Legionella longbeachae]